jgi:hypothetical protein
MRRSIPRLLPLVLAASGLAISACSEQPAQKQSQPNPAQSNTNASSSGTKTQAVGTITANPNPIQVCDRSGTGVAVLSWTSKGAATVEVRVGKPDGDLFGKTGPDGSGKTGKWVGDGMIFYLQDVSGGKPLTAENTIATTVVNVTAVGCP